MNFFTEAKCTLLRLYAGLWENIDDLSPVEDGVGTKLGNIFSRINGLFDT